MMGMGGKIRPAGGKEAAQALGLEPASVDEKSLLGGADHEGGGYDADARRLAKALQSGDGDTVHSILKGIVMDIMEQRDVQGPDMMGAVDEDGFTG